MSDCIDAEIVTGSDVEIKKNIDLVFEVISADQLAIEQAIDVEIEVNNWTLVNDAILIQRSSGAIDPELQAYIESMNQNLFLNDDFMSMWDWLTTLDGDYHNFVISTNDGFTAQATHVEVLKTSIGENHAYIADVDHLKIDGEGALAISKREIGVFFEGAVDAGAWYEEISRTLATATSANSVNISRVRASLDGVEAIAEQILEATVYYVRNPLWDVNNLPGTPTVDEKDPGRCDVPYDDNNGQAKCVLHQKAAYTLNLDPGQGYISGVYAQNIVDGGVQRDIFQIATTDFAVIDPNLAYTGAVDPEGKPIRTPDYPWLDTVGGNKDPNYDPKKFLIRYVSSNNSQAARVPTGSLMVNGGITSYGWSSNPQNTNSFASMLDSAELKFYRNVPADGDLSRADVTEYLKSVAISPGPIQHGVAWNIDTFFGSEAPLVFASPHEVKVFHTAEQSKDQVLTCKAGTPVERTDKPGFWKCTPTIGLKTEFKDLSYGTSSVSQGKTTSNYTRDTAVSTVPAACTNINVKYNTYAHTCSISQQEWDECWYTFWIFRSIKQADGTWGAWSQVAYQYRVWSHRVKDELKLDGYHQTCQASSGNISFKDTGNYAANSVRYFGRMYGQVNNDDPNMSSSMTGVSNGYDGTVVEFFDTDGLVNMIAIENSKDV